MNRDIVVYGHGIDKDDADTLSVEAFQHYMKDLVFSRDKSRYRYTQRKNANVIVLSWQGLALGTFVVAGKAEPNDEDRAAYPRVNCVYKVVSSVVYDNPVKLRDIDIANYQFGKRISEEQLAQIESLAGGSTTHEARDLEAERVKSLREVLDRPGQAGFRKALLAAYGEKCVITGCDAALALEAAHILPYSESLSDDVRNGLLLRADVHTLFDLDLIGIEPKTLTIRLAKRLRDGSYEDYHEMQMCVPDGPSLRPDESALLERWKRFQTKN